MRNLKKFLALVLAMIMVVGASAVVSADFTDVAADSDYAAAINDLAVKGIVRGTSDTTFTPDADVQRYQMALFVARATTGEVGVEADSTLWANGIVPFADVTEYKGAIQYAFLNGIIKGRTESTFDPAGNIAYVDALTMAVRALGYTNLEYPWGFYNKAVELGLTANVAIDALYTTLDRAETAQIIYNMIYAERADSDVSFAAENFDLDVVRTTDLFVITATPKQSYANGYEADADVGKGTYVGVQPLVNGVPAGEIMYIPVEKLGIEAADVENYLNYAVELINYDAETGEFYDAKLGAAPERVYFDKVEFVANTEKVIIDGTTYNLVENIGGTALKNELVAFSGADVNESQAKFLLEDVDGNVYAANGINSVLGTPVAKRIQFSGSNTKFYAVLVADGTNLTAGSVITEAAALEAWGFETTDVQYTKYATLTATQIANNLAFELQLFDDDVNGLYDRAIVNPVYMTVYGTYEKNIDRDSAKEVCDKLVFTHTGNDVEGADVTYSEELTVGTVFTYTYNEVTNSVYVIDTLELQTAKLNKIDTTADDGFKLTFGDTTYTAKLGYDQNDLGAIAKIFNDTGKSVAEGLTLANLNKAAIFNLKTDWINFLKTSALGFEYNFYTVNGNVIFAEAVAEEAAAAAKTEFVVLDSVADFDFGKMDLNVYANGEEKVVALNKFGSITLADLPSWYYGLFIGKVENFFKGSIYAINNTADGINVLGFVDDTNYADYVDAEGNQYLQLISIDEDAHGLINDDVITFDRGIVRVGANDEDLAYGDRIRTNSKTVFYFIDYGTGIDNEADTEIAVYVGAPEDATITLDDHTYILVDKIGYRANNTTQGTTNLIIVVNALDYDFDVEEEREYYGYFIGNEEVYVADDATDLGLEGYAKGAKFYEFENGAIDIDTGKTITVYAPVNTLELGKVYEFDANGVILGYEDMTTAPAGTTLAAIAALSNTDKYEMIDGQALAIDCLVEEKTYDVSVAGGTIFDYDEYVIKAATLVNIGEDIEIKRTGMSTLEYDALSTHTAWNMVVNFFLYDDNNGNDVESDVFTVKVSNTELLFLVAAK